MKSNVNSLQLDGDTVLFGSVECKALLYNSQGYYAMLSAATTPTDSLAGCATGCLWLNTSGGSNTTLYVNEGSATSTSWKVLRTTAGGGGGGGSLDDAYSNGQTITVDEGTIALTDATAGALDTFSINKTGAGSGDLIQLTGGAAATGAFTKMTMGSAIAAYGLYIDNSTGARTGSDIYVVSDSTGAHSVIDINASGSGASIGFDWQGSFNGSPAGYAISLTLDNGDNLDTIPFLISSGSGNRGVMFDLNLGHTDAATSSHVFDIDVSAILDSNIFDFATSAACTGNVIYMNLDTAVAMTGLHIEGSGVRTEPMVELATDCTGAATLFAIDITGAGTGNVLAIGIDAALASNVIDVDMNLGVGSRALYLDCGGGTRTANLVEVKWDGDGATDVMQITATNTGTGNVFDINLGGAMTGGAVLDVDMDAALAASFLILDYGNGVRTEDMCQVTFDGSGTNPFWDINITNTGAGGTSDYWDIDVSGIFTGSILDVVYSAAATGTAIVLDMTSAVAAPALAITLAGARTDDGIQINDASTGAGARSVFDINITGAGTFPVLDISTGNTSINCTPILLSLGTGARTVPIINIDDTGTTSAATIHLIDIDFTAAGSGNAIDIEYSVAAHTGDAIQLVMGTNVAGSALVVTGTGIRTDDLFKIDSDHTGAGLIWDINLTGAATGNVFDLTYSVGANSGNAISLAMGTNVGGQAIVVTSAATGVSGEGSALDISHTGNLVAGAELIRIISTGNHDATSNVVHLEQNTGAGTAGTNLLYLKATGTNVEAIEIEAGVLFEAEITATPGAGDGETLPITGNTIFYDPNGASRTGVILTAGLRDGQRVTIVNIADAAETITFAAAGVSNVAGGAAVSIAQFECLMLIWNATRSLWYCMGAGL